MSLSRRDFVRTGTSAALLGVLPARRLFAQPVVTSDAVVLNEFAQLAQEDEMRVLALRAVDAARAAGAAYADVRLTRVVSQSFDHRQKRVVRAEVSDEESYGFGVRALVNGYWGFAASPYWEPEEAAQLAQAAVGQAKANAQGSSRIVEWEPVPAATGSWVCPGIDPFSITVEEKIDFLNAWRQAVNETYIPGYVLQLDTARMAFSRTEWLMASTEGTVISQILYNANGKFPIGVGSSDWATQRQHGVRGNEAKRIFSQRGGWEIMLDAKIRDQIPALADATIKTYEWSEKPVDIGRFDVVLDAASTASLVGKTIGVATQLDRAIGFEANAGGTSYLGPDPMQFLGAAPVAAPLVNIKANRSMSKGCATVKWDDEGVLPDEFSLVKDGLLVDYQTTREQAPWIKGWYQKQRQPVRSHGCAVANSALAIPIQQPPNLVLEPGKTAASFDSLVAGIKRGYACIGGGVSTDFQAKSGTGFGLVREIVNGKLGDVVQRAGFMFTSTELWKDIVGIGDATSAQVVTLGHGKGQPFQSSQHSVSAVPIAVKNVSIVDIGRRA